MATIMFENSRYPIAPITLNGVDKRYSIADINELAASIETHHKRQTNKICQELDYTVSEKATVQNT